MQSKYKFGCTGKMWWSTEAEARTYYKRIKFKGDGKQWVAKHFYKCRHENHWHATSMSNKEFKEKGFYRYKLKKIKANHAE